MEVFHGIVDILEHYYLGAFFIMLLSLGASLYFFCGLRSILGWSECIFLGITALFLHLCVFSVDIVNTVYWVAASFLYQIGVILLLFSLGALMRLWLAPQSRQWSLNLPSFFILTVSIFLAAGTTEQIMCMQTCLYGMFVVFQFVIAKSTIAPTNKGLDHYRKKLLVYVFIVALLSLGFYFMLPGSQTRFQTYGQQKGLERSLIRSIGWSLIVGEKYWYKALVTMALLSSTFFLKPTLLRFVSRLSPTLANRQGWCLSMLIVFCVLAPSLLYLPVSYAFRIKNPNPHLGARVGVPISAFFVYSWPFFMMIVHHLFTRLQEPVQGMILKCTKSFIVVIFSGIVLTFALGYQDDFIRNHTLFNRGTIKNSIADLTSGRSQAFDNITRRIHKALKEAQVKGIKDIVILDPYPIALSSFNTVDRKIATDDPKHWINNWTCVFFGCKTIRVTKNRTEVNVHY